MKYILSESQLRLVLNSKTLIEQIPDTRFMSPVEKKAHYTHGLGRPLSHDEMMTLSILAALGGPIGLGVSTLLNVMNAVSYATEGENKDAGLQLIFAVLPFLPVGKVLGVVGKSKEYMKALAGKIIRKQKLNAEEVQIIKNVQQNKQTIINNIENKAKNVAEKLTTSNSLPNSSRSVLTKVAAGTISLAKELAAHMAVITGYDLAYDKVVQSQANKI